MSTELIVTLAVLVAEIALMLYARKKLKEPPDPLKPRLVPYGLIMIFLAVGIFVAGAHVISVITGVRLEPKNKMKGQR